MTATDLEVAGVPWGFGPRRTVLDQALVNAAIEAGAEFRDQFTVDEFLIEDGQVRGCRGRLKNHNKPVAEHACITIGADGRNSLLARAVEAPTYNAQPALSCWYFSYWSGVPNAMFELYLRDHKVIFSFVTTDQLFMVAVAWPRPRFQDIKTDIEGHFMAAVDAVPGFGERVRAGRREERFYGAADLPNFYRKPWGAGWALVGDAGYHKDPYMATGIADAFRDAELLATAIHRGFAGEMPLDHALAGYEEARNRATAEEYQENLRWASLQPPPREVLRLREALRGNQDEINHFTKARLGMIPREEFFNPENMNRILGRAQLLGT